MFYPFNKKGRTLFRHGFQEIYAKYYTNSMQQHFDTYSVHSGNLYQIFTHVKNKEAEMQGIPHTVSGMLLYAKTENEHQPDFSYMMGENKIEVKTLDLNQEFPIIAAFLKKIAKEYFFTTTLPICS